MFSIIVINRLKDVLLMKTRHLTALNIWVYRSSRCVCSSTQGFNPVTGTNFVVCSYGKFQPGYRDEKESKRARNVDWGPGNEFEHA